MCEHDLHPRAQKGLLCIGDREPPVPRRNCLFTFEKRIDEGASLSDIIRLNI